MAHLARPYQVAHGADGLLDRHGAVHPMLVVQVDVVGAEPLERRVARSLHVVGPAVHAEPLPLFVALVAELGGEHDLVAPAANGRAHQPLVGERPVHVGRIEEGDAEIESAVDGGDRLGVIPAGVELGHSHAAEAEGGDDEIGGTEAARVHGAMARSGFAARLF